MSDEINSLNRKFEILYTCVVDDVDEGVISSREHTHTIASGIRSPDLRTIGRDIKEGIRKSFIASSQ